MDPPFGLAAKHLLQCFEGKIVDVIDFRNGVDLVSVVPDLASAALGGN
jgi:hypothetical protein